MDEVESLSHTKWECKYHVVFIPKMRRKVLYAGLLPNLLISAHPDYVMTHRLVPLASAR